MGYSDRIVGLERVRAGDLQPQPRYCDVAVARWEAFTGQKAELA